ncbi:MAG: hypothetical protein LDL24_06105, partial [Treponema sp.]|nr:hypothetical protein [Treponema sp.]
MVGPKKAHEKAHCGLPEVLPQTPNSPQVPQMHNLPHLSRASQSRRVFTCLLASFLLLFGSAMAFAGGAADNSNKDSKTGT